MRKKNKEDALVALEPCCPLVIRVSFRQFARRVYPEPRQPVLLYPYLYFRLPEAQLTLGPFTCDNPFQ